MPANYVLLETIELTQSAASVTFDNIPQTGYTDLKVVVSSRTNATVGASGYYYNVTFNGTSANRTGRYLEGTGTGVGTGSFALYGVSDASDNTASTFSNGEFYIPNYASANFKSTSSDSVQENNATASRAVLVAALWSDTAAITSITFTPAGGSFVANSTFSLYGLAAFGTTPTVVPFATGGNIIAQDGTYWYHAFLSSGTFTPAKALSCDYLVVAGGGGGGRDYYAGGGGGAGGLRSTVSATGGGASIESAIPVLAQAYSISVGAGGSGGGAGGGGNGTSSIFSTITSTGGGGGGGNNSDSSSSGVGVAGKTGGSGGGGGSSGGSAGARTVGQGFIGGSSGTLGGAGGGGAGVIGNSTSSSDGANGGNGVSISAFATATNTGVSNFYAGGGAGAGNARSAGPSGATGGAGGGGNSPAANGSGTLAPVVSTGSGGYGGNGNSGPHSGASGIVIIRYPIV